MEVLDAYLDHDKRYGLAFSGGVDSSYLLAYLVDGGYDVKAYFVDTAFQADFERADVIRMLAETGADSAVLTPDILSRDEICSNPDDRCYHCKRYLFSRILREMDADARTVLLDGTNASDDPDRRPGMRALTEMHIVSPLRLAGMTKDDIRAASRQRGLFTADKPNYSCLATKVPTGTRITAERLHAVAVAEGME